MTASVKTPWSAARAITAPLAKMQNARPGASPEKFALAIAERIEKASRPPPILA